MEQKRWYFYYVVGAAVAAFLSSALVAMALLVPLAIGLLLAGLRVRPEMMRACSHGYLVWFLLTELQVMIIFHIGADPLLGLLLTYALGVALGIFLLMRLRLPRAGVILVLLLSNVALLYLLLMAAVREERLDVVAIQLHGRS